MNVTVFKPTVSGKSETVKKIDFNSLITNVKDESLATGIKNFRKDFLSLSMDEVASATKFMARVCPVAEFYRNKAKERVFARYNGVVVVKIGGLCSSLEVERAKKEAAMMPQTLLAAVGADGVSVIVLTGSTLPDGSLPQNKEEALRHHAKAYATAVMCLQPLVEFQIEVTEPSLEDSFLMTYDAEPYYNRNATPFIVDMSSEMALKAMAQNAGTIKPLKGLKPGADAYCTITTVYNAAYMRALETAVWKPGDDVESLIVRIAEECCFVGLPEEETVKRTSFHFRERNINEIRSSVRTVYEQNEDHRGTRGYMYKHQLVAYRLREFLNRRYDIRFNEVLQMTEYRERNSLWFDFHELGERELNAIYHEALLEGIESTFGEIDKLVHSTFVKMYNPIESYLGSLPAWDGKDRIVELAERVPTDNPYWTRLFRQWLLSVVAHWMNGDERHANSTAPILIGAQGFRKSTFCRMLLPPELQMFYTDSIDFRSNIEAERCLSRFLLVNIDEFDQLSERQFAFVKHLFQKPATNIRRMYSEAIGKQRRYASFIGTTNSDEVLRDPTGNRRYLCVNVTGVINTETAINHAQLYAQLVHLINNGERYWLNDADEALIKQMNKQFEQTMPLEELFLSVFENGEGREDSEWIRLTDIMSTLRQQPIFNTRRDNNLQVLGIVLTKLRIQKRRHNTGMEYLVRRK